MNIIELKNLQMAFGAEVALQPINKSFASGQIHGIVGNNGSGKTVLMKCICGLLVPTSGSVIVNGKRIGIDQDFPDDLGLIIETPGFLPQLSGFKNLSILASLKGRIGPVQIAAVMKKVGLDPASKKPVGKYSLGMRQRLGIAQAIMEDPAILVLDEPFNGLDKHGTAQMHALFFELKRQGKTMLLASHNQRDIELLCDSVCEMDAGAMTIIKEAP